MASPDNRKTIIYMKLHHSREQKITNILKANVCDCVVLYRLFKHKRVIVIFMIFIMEVTDTVYYIGSMRLKRRIMFLQI